MRAEAFRTIRLAIPIIIGELAQMTLNLVDSAMVGQLSYKHLAATALVVNAMNLPFVIGIGMTIAVSQMVSLAHGRNEPKRVSHYLFNGFILCAATAIVISMLMVLSGNILYHLGQDPEVVVLAKPFLTLIGLSIIPMLLFMTLKQFADGLQFTRTAMILSVSAVPVNAFLNWMFIYGNLGAPRLELVGAGISTLITRTIMFIILAIVIVRHRVFREFISDRAHQWKLRASTLKELLHIGIPSSLQIGMEAGAFAVSGIIIGTLGAVAQASHQIALSCASFTFMVSMGLAQAGSIRVSNSYGGGNWKTISRIGKSTLWTALAYGLFCGVLFVVFHRPLPIVFNDNRMVIEMASMLLLFAAVFQISDATQAIGAGLLRGIKDVKVPTILVGIAYWVIGIPSGYLFAFPLGLGPSGMWLGLTLGLTMSSLFLVLRFLKMSRSRLKVA